MMGDSGFDFLVVIPSDLVLRFISRAMTWSGNVNLRLVCLVVLCRCRWAGVY